MGLSLTRRWLGAATAAVLVVVMAVFVFVGPVQADDSLTSPGVDQTVASTELASTFSSPSQVSSTPGAAVEESAPALKHKAVRAASPTELPEGSPLYVQLILIVILVVLGAGYFKLMGHSGRRAPKAKPAETDEKQSIDA